ncbi:MAG: DNA repair protein RadA [Thermoanaerobaculum sp.]|nr:DNA repair protein RadA [Thermoanaerobaculum sp.]MDW7967855.1 DNA repair protein RadA [Thermoanaerobaculum sp.]
MGGKTDLWSCTHCGYTAGKWFGRCPSCGAFNTFARQPDRPRGRTPSRRPPQSVVAANVEEFPRLATGLAGCDRVLGGGLVKGSLVLLAGEPGVGKSTLLLQLGHYAAAFGPVLYATGEESETQVALRARRLACQHPNLFLLAESTVEAVLDATRTLQPVLLLVDSVQAMRSEAVPSIPGSIPQVREVASRLAEAVKGGGPPAILVGHVTKDGTVAGPKSLEHLVDVVLELSGSTSHAHRVLRATKNRFGPALELSLFAMGAKGLEEVPNPSQVLLADRVTGAPGSAATVVLEGLTPLCVEIQALVSPSPLLNPRRVAQGFDAGRLALLLAVMEKRAGIKLVDRDVYVNVAGGLEVAEPAADLAVVAAVFSSFRDSPLPHDAVFFGEVGLLGEVRAVGRGDARLREAETLGFCRAFAPPSVEQLSKPGLVVTGIPDVRALGKHLKLLD